MSSFVVKHKRITFALVALVLVTGFTLYQFDTAAGATYTWDNDSLDGLWSTCSNWTSDTCPTSSDIAKFDSSTTSDAVLDSSFAGSVAGVDIDSGYTGTITQQRNLTIGSSDFNQAAGTWIQATTSFDINNGDFILSAGTFETGISTSTVEDNFTISGGTYTASSSSVVDFNGSVGATTVLSCTGTLPGLIDISKTHSSYGFTLGSGCEVTTINSLSTGGDTIVNNGTINFGTSPDINTGYTNNGTTTFEGSSITITDDLDQNGVWDLTGKTIIFDGGIGATTNLSCTGQLGGLIDINKTHSSYGFTLGSGCEATTTSSVSTGGGAIVNNGIIHFGTSLDLNNNGGYTNNGTTTFEGSSITITDDLDQSGVWDLSAVTITFDGGVGATTLLSCTGDLGGLIDINKTHSSYGFTLASGCSIKTTTVTTGGGAIVINGTLDTDGSTFTTTNSFTLGSGGTLRLHGDESITSPTLSSNSTVEYYGNGTYNSLIAGTDYKNISFTGGGTYNITSSLTVNDDFISSNDSNFNQTAGGTTFDGTNQTITGTSTFNTLTKSVTSADTLTFAANQTQTISSTLTLQGDSDSQLTVDSTATGTEYYLDMQGLRIIEYLTLSDANNIDATTAYCSTGCIDGNGNNTNISFGADPDDGYIYWDDGGGDSNWSTCDNWTYNYCPDANYTAAFDSRSTAASTLDASFAGEVKGLVIDSGYSGTITSNRSLTVGSDGFSQADGSFVAPATTLTLSGNFTHNDGTFTHNSGTVVISGNSTLTPTTSTQFSAITIGDADYLTSLSSYLKLDESSGGSTVQDSTSNDNDGTPLGSSGANDKPQPTSTVPSTISFSNPYALDFDGTDDYVNVEPSPVSTSANTVSLWVRFDSNSGAVLETTANGVVGETTPYMLLQNNSGTLRIYQYGVGYSNISAVSTDTWYHVAIVRTTDSEIVYLDGNEEVNRAITTTGDNVEFHFGVGFGGYMNGQIDDVRIYDEALSEAQVDVLAAGNKFVEGGTSYVTLSSKTLDATGDLTIIGDITTFDVSESGCSGAPCDIEVAGDWTNNGGTFTPRSGTVTFDGTNQTITGNTTFNNFTKSVTSADTLSFNAGDTTTVTNSLTLQGQSGNLLTINSTTPGSEWKLSANTFNSTVEYVDLSDSNSISTRSSMYCYPGCINSDGNTNWVFGEKPESQWIFRLQNGTQLQGGSQIGGS